MMKSFSQTKLFFAVVLSLLVLSGCRKNDKLQFEQQKKPAYGSLQKDSLVFNMISAIKLINDIDDSLSAISREIRTPKISESEKIPSMQENIRLKLRLVAEKLRQYKSDIKSLAFVNKNYSSFISTLQKTINLREKQLGELQLQVGELKRRLNEKERELGHTLKILVSEVKDKHEMKYSLSKEISTLSSENDHLKYTAYYVYGTEQELEKKGLLRYSGGIFLFGLGKAAVPSSFDENSQFNKIDTRYALELSFPSEIKSIISPQNQKYCSIEGSRLKITDGHRFWEGSRYLFVITKK